MGERDNTEFGKVILSGENTRHSVPALNPLKVHASFPNDFALLTNVLVLYPQGQNSADTYQTLNTYSLTSMNG